MNSDEVRDKLAKQYAHGVAQPILRSMINMSRGEFADYLESAYKMGFDVAREPLDAEVQALRDKLDRAKEALLFYAGNWGPHQGTVNETTNRAIQVALYKKGEVAIECLADLEKEGE